MPSKTTNAKAIRIQQAKWIHGKLKQIHNKPSSLPQWTKLSQSVPDKRTRRRWNHVDAVLTSTKFVNLGSLFTTNRWTCRIRAGYIHRTNTEAIDRPLDHRAGGGSNLVLDFVLLGLLERDVVLGQASLALPVLQKYEADLTDQRKPNQKAAETRWITRRDNDRSSFPWKHEELTIAGAAWTEELRGSTLRFRTRTGRIQIGYRLEAVVRRLGLA